MSQSQWTPFYEGDYIRDTRHLSQGEHGAYILLLTSYWTTEKPLPLDKNELYRIGSAFTAEEKRNLNRVLQQFFTEELDGWHNKKSDEIILKKKDKRRALSENGRKGGKAKAKANASNLPEQMPKQMGKHNQNYNQNNTKPDGLAQSANHPIWGDALQMLTEQGEKEASARAFLGRAVQQHGEGAVNDAISACVINSPVNAKAYLMACLKAKPKISKANGLTLGRSDIVPAEQRTGGVLKL